jgi:SAM-dependent methyltransferase
LTSKWDLVWQRPPDVRRALAEERSPRWRDIERFVRARWGQFEGLRVVEIGSGHGTYGIHFAKRGSDVVLVDRSANALYGASELARAMRTRALTMQADLFHPPPHLLRAFDVSISFGLCEHFVGAEREDVIRTHFEYLRPHGVAMISVPNRWCVPYRMAMAALKATNRWMYGVEVPFSEHELVELVERSGGRVLAVCYGSFAATIVAFLIKPILQVAGYRRLEVPQWRSTFDRFAYELTVIADKEME